MPPLSAAEQFALDTLLDLSRVLVGGEGAGGVAVAIRGAPEPLSVADARARGWCIEAGDGGVVVERALLTLVNSIAGAVTEQRSTAADRFGRVPPTENELVRCGEERDPVVNRAAAALRAAVVAAADRRPVALVAPWPEGKRWAVAMTHDLDIVALWPAYSALRVAQLAAGGDVLRALRVAGNAAASLAHNPVWRAAEHVLATEKRLGIRSTWFVIAATPTLSSIRAGDVTYVPESPAARRIVTAATAAGNEVGLHGSFASFTFRDVFTEQRTRLVSLARSPIGGVRQHFLRMRPGASHAAMSDAGFAYDSTFGFSERNGFRLGVADVVPVWDEQGQRALGLDEAPFVWMDRALSKYRKLEDPHDWIADARVIADTCRQVDGLWTGIWHPNMSDALGFPGAPAAFETLCDHLMANAPWATTLGSAVAWRRARRAARCAGVDASGNVRLVAPPGDAAAAIALESPSGAPLRFQRA